CPPFIRVPSQAQQADLEDFTHRLASLDSKLQDRLAQKDSALADGFQTWADEAEKVYDRKWKPIASFQIESEMGTHFEHREDGSIVATSNGAATDTYTLRFTTTEKGIAGFRLEALRDENLPEGGPGLASNGNFMLSRVEVSEIHTAYEAKENPVPITETYADFEQTDFPARDILDDQEDTGWAVLPEVGNYHRLVFNPAHRIGDGEEVQITFRLEFHHVAPVHLLGHFRISYTTERDPLYSPWSVLGPLPSASTEEAFSKDFGPETDLDLAKTYFDGDHRWRERPDLEDGVVQDLEGSGIAATYLYRTIYTPEERKTLLFFGSNDGIQVWLNGKSILAKNVGRPVAENQEKLLVTLKPGDNRLLMKINNQGGGYGFYFRSDLRLDGTDRQMADAFRVADDQRTDEEKRRIRHLYRLAVDPIAAELQSNIDSLQSEKAKVEGSIPTLRVMRDMEEKRPTHVLVRGDYRNLGKEVTADVPAFLPDLP
ncbi:MAG: hypothetical protein KC931_22675, partial [Candidatus Omnitrophica bacterium]|nr:hypothetical protein [Candidatus Omnitrophota bacterium]